MATTTFRSLYATFWDDPDARALSDRAYRVLTTLKGTLPASGIGAVYDDVVAERCSCSESELHVALEELERPKRDGGLGWIMRERNIVWVINGLRFEPSMSSANPKHCTHIAECLAQFAGGGASSFKIVREFKRHYADWFRNDPDTKPPKTEVRTAAAKRSSKSLSQTHTESHSETVSDTPSDSLDESQHYTTHETTLNNTSAQAREAGGDEIQRPKPQPVASADVVPIDSAPGRRGYLTRCVVALNLGMQANPAVAGACMEVSTSSQAASVTWESDGIAVETAEEVIRRVSATFKPSQRSRQISGLKYFDGAVRERHQQLVEVGADDRSSWVRGAKNASDSAWLSKQGY